MTIPNDVMNTESARKLRSYFDRAMNLLNDRDAISEELKELFIEVKDDGFTPAILRKVIARRRKDPTKLSEEDALIEVYSSAIQGDLFQMVAEDKATATIQIGDGEPIPFEPANHAQITKAIRRGVRA